VTVAESKDRLAARRPLRIGKFRSPSAQFLVALI
jgi:hypothetical protein